MPTAYLPEQLRLIYSNVVFNIDKLLKNHKWDGTVKSSKCKLSLAKSRFRGLANLEECGVLTVRRNDER